MKIELEDCFNTKVKVPESLLFHTAMRKIVKTEIVALLDMAKY